MAEKLDIKALLIRIPIVVIAASFVIAGLNWLISKAAGLTGNAANVVTLVLTLILLVAAIMMVGKNVKAIDLLTLVLYLVVALILMSLFQMLGWKWFSLATDVTVVNLALLIAGFAITDAILQKILPRGVKKAIM
jgi:hypothetical protein